jgi:hypothetical protein
MSEKLQETNHTESNSKYGNTYTLKKMMKHVKKSLSLKKGGNGDLPKEETKPTEKPNSIFSYMKHFMDSIFDRENYLKKQKEEQLNGMREPYDTTMANLADIKPVDIGPAVAYEEYVKSVQNKENQDETLKEIQEQPEYLAESKQLLEEGNHIQSQAIQDIENIKQGILEKLKSATERLQVPEPSQQPLPQQPQSQEQSQSQEQQPTDVPVQLLEQPPIIEVARPLETYVQPNESPSLKKSNFLK